MIMNNDNDADRHRRDFESVRQQHWSVDLLCALALIFVIGGGLYECTGDEPPRCECAKAAP